ncbi:MAG: lysine 2,3-aminomutase [Prolixibacteraceae bacterium]|nr:lysine 2,3-aminomutase [Prolixibacteraceae bacterium]MBN2773820.1 lysine 2,3-aminomutase [Prolixibacteraceae bacterium]
MKYKSFTLHNFRQIPQIEKLSEEQKFAIETVGNVLPFRVSNYVIDELIDWDNFENDPFFILTFPQKGMLSEYRFEKIAGLLKNGASHSELTGAINKIRLDLNPNPAGQERNVPVFEGKRLNGIQHKYRETMLFFPTQGQTCHSYCTFCFRWPQFALNDFRFAMKEAELMVRYLRSQPEITDVLFTGGDPAVMKTRFFEHYFNALLDANIPHLKNIRIGTKALTYWPYRFTNDDDADDLLRLFEKVKKKGVNIALMAHLNHPGELKTKAVKNAIDRLLNAGVQIRSQSPLLKNINNSSSVWAENWKLQLTLGIIPYYMFIARNTGAQNYFAVTLEQAWRIYKNAFKQVSGIHRTVRGPSMSTNPGKIQVLGISEIMEEKVFVLTFLQARNPNWVGRPFYAAYDEDALWLDDLLPAFNKEEFFFEESTRIFNFQN